MSSLSTESFYTTLEQKFSTVFFFLNGVVANSSNPFRILINDECVLKLEANCNGVVYATQVEEPRVGGHHFIRVKADCPLLRSGSGLSSQYERYNLSINGFFILIDCTEEIGGSDSGIRVIQQKHDNFGPNYKNYKFGNKETENAVLKASSSTKNLIRSNLPPKQIEEQLKKLEQLFRKDILTREEFEAKWKMVYNPANSGCEITYSSNNSNNEVQINNNDGLTQEQLDLLSKLRGLIGRGIITQEEYNAKLNKMKEENQKSSAPKQPSLTPEQKQMLEKLESLLSKGILTQEEFNAKKKQIVGSLDNSTPTTPVANESSSERMTFEKYAQQYEDLKCMMNESQKHQMRTLERFVNDEIITQDEYEMKKKKVLGNLYTPTNWNYQKKLSEKEQSTSNSPSSPATPSTESLSESQKDRLEKLKISKEKGILTNEMFESRMQQILDENKPVQDTEDYSHLTSDQQNYIAKLKYFKKMGILTASEFDIQMEKVISDPESIIKNGALVSPPQTPTTSSSSPKTPRESTDSKPSTPTIVSKSSKPSTPTPVFTSEEVETPVTPTGTGNSQNNQQKSDTAPEPTRKVEEQKKVITTPVVETKKQPSPNKAIVEPSKEIVKQANPTKNNSVVEQEEEIQDQLERLRSLVDMGIISEEDYKLKEEKLLKGTPTPASPAATPEEVKPVLNQQATNNQIKQLEKLFNSGIISKEDYDQKVNKILGKSQPESTPTKKENSPSPSSPRNTTSNAKDQNIQVELTKLKKLLDNGIISQEQFEMKQSKLLGTSSGQSSPRTKEKELSSEQKEQVAKLKSFLDEGLIDKDEYQEELNQILNQL